MEELLRATAASAGMSGLPTSLLSKKALASTPLVLLFIASSSTSSAFRDRARVQCRLNVHHAHPVSVC